MFHFRIAMSYSAHYSVDVVVNFAGDQLCKSSTVSI